MALGGDERAQAVQIGAVLLFGILIVSLSINQAFIVPNQNRNVEFNHFSESQNEMEELRNVVVEAGNSGETVPASVTLGTSYPPRMLAAQPQQSSGTLRTAQIGSREIQLQNTDADMTNICGLSSPTTRSAVYSPSYSYLDSVENITYENTVTYTNGNPDGRFFQTDQQLFVNNSIQVYPLIGSYNEGGSAVASVTLRGGETGENSSVAGPFDLILPTRLSVSDWSRLLQDEPNVSVSPASGEAVTLSFADTFNGNPVTYDIKCSPAGAGSAPNNDPSVGANDDEINPAAPGDIKLLDQRQATDTYTSGSLELRFESDAKESLSITDARINFFQTDAKEKKAPDQIRFYDENGQEAGVLPIGDDFVTLSESITFAPEQQTDIRIDLEDSNGDDVTLNQIEDGWFVLTVNYDNGEAGTYFVPVPDETTY